jgi:3-oxoacyl-[acyl-carrier-protein] synthase-1
MKVYISGIGCISAIGLNKETTEESLKKSKSGISPISVLETKFRDEFKAGEIKLTDQQLSELTEYPYVEDSRTTLLGVSAVREALRDAQLSPHEILNTPLLSATTVAGMVRTEKYFKQFLDQKSTPDFILSHNSSFHTERIVDFLKMNLPLDSVNSACSSSATAIVLATRLIQSGVYNRIVVGGTDALCRYSLNGFNSLMLLDKNTCRPFDASRAGINLGEGAAYIVLENELCIKNKKNYGFISGYGITNDAFHQTSISPDGEGVVLAMKSALERAYLSADKIDYINAHGTGTQNNDLTEGNAIKSVFGPKPVFGSTKSFTGHMLAAAGAMETIISLIALNSGFAPVNINFETEIPEHRLKPVTSTENRKMAHVMSNSVGIGGFCTSLIVSK